MESHFCWLNFSCGGVTKFITKNSATYTLIIIFFIRLKSCNCTRIKLFFFTLVVLLCCVWHFWYGIFSVLLLPVTLPYNKKLFILAIFYSSLFFEKNNFCATFALKTKTCFFCCCCRRCYSCFTLRRWTTYNVFKNKYIFFLIKMA